MPDSGELPALNVEVVQRVRPQRAGGLGRALASILYGRGRRFRPCVFDRCCPMRSGRGHGDGPPVAAVGVLTLMTKSGVSLQTIDLGHFPNVGGNPGAMVTSDGGMRGHSGAISPRKTRPLGGESPNLVVHHFHLSGRPSDKIHRYGDEAVHGTPSSA